jgi:hypothetical protein
VRTCQAWKEKKKNVERKGNSTDATKSALSYSVLHSQMPYHTVCSEKRRKVEEEKEEGKSKSEGFWRVPAICVRPPGAGLEDKVLNGLVEVGLVDKRKGWRIEQEDAEKGIEKRKHRRSVRLRNSLDVAPMSSLIVRRVLNSLSGGMVGSDVSELGQVWEGDADLLTWMLISDILE